MAIHVCVFLKRILDPELPATRFRIDADAKDARVEGAPYVMGPYDENALETALQMKDRDPSVRVTAVSYGPPEAEELLRKALSAGADDAVLVAAEGGIHDAFHVASVLASVCRRLGDVGVALLGLQSGDWDSGQTAFALAEHLDAASVSLAAEVTQDGTDHVRVRRVLEAGTERVRTTLPCVVSVTNDGTNALRMAKVKDILAAKRKTVERLGLADLSDVAAPATEVLEVTAPEVQKSVCTWIEGDTGQDRGRALAQALSAAHLL